MRARRLSDAPAADMDSAASLETTGASSDAPIDIAEGRARTCQASDEAKKESKDEVPLKEAKEESTERNLPRRR